MILNASGTVLSASESSSQTTGRPCYLKIDLEAPLNQYNMA